jgi:hypothetical protein
MPENPSPQSEPKEPPQPTLRDPFDVSKRGQSLPTRRS